MIVVYEKLQGSFPHGYVQDSQYVKRDFRLFFVLFFWFDTLVQFYHLTRLKLLSIIR